MANYCHKLIRAIYHLLLVHNVTLERIKPDYAEEIPDTLTLQPGEIFTFSPRTTEMHIFQDTASHEKTIIAIGGPY
jgi:hypothetical protein